MKKLWIISFALASVLLAVQKIEAKPNDCIGAIQPTALSKAQMIRFKQLPKGSSQATIKRALGAPSCQLKGYAGGLTAYAYQLSYNPQNWLVVVFENGKLLKAQVLPYGLALREG
jgi:hypothetical protein